MSWGKFEVRRVPLRKVKNIGEPCPYIGDCSTDIASRNGYCTGEYESCSDFMARIEQEVEERR